MDVGLIEKRDEQMSTPVWVGNIPGMGDAEFLVLPLSNPGVTRYQSKLFRNLETTDLEDGSITDEAERRIDVLLVKNKLLHGWKGFKAGDDEFPYTDENVDRMLKSDVFLGAVRYASAKAGKKANQQFEALIKNSNPSSNGPSATAE